MINNVRTVVAATSENNARGTTTAISRFTRITEVCRRRLCTIPRVNVRLLYRVLCSKAELQRLHQRLRKLRISLYVSSARRGATWNFGNDSVCSAYGTTEFLWRGSFVITSVLCVHACPRRRSVNCRGKWSALSHKVAGSGFFRTFARARASHFFSFTLLTRCINLTVVNKNSLLFFLYALYYALYIKREIIVALPLCYKAK